MNGLKCYALKRSSVVFVYENYIRLVGTEDRDAYIGLLAKPIKINNFRILAHCQEYCFPRLSRKKQNNSTHLLLQ